METTDRYRTILKEKELLFSYREELHEYPCSLHRIGSPYPLPR